MEFTCYTRWQQLPERSDELFACAEAGSLFFSRPWLMCLSATVLEDDESLLLACVVDDERVLALLPIVRTGSEHWQVLTHRYSSLTTVLLAGEDRTQVLECLAGGLHRLSLRSLSLDPVAQDDADLRELRRAMAASGFDCHEHFRFYNWFHRTQGQSFDDYMAGRPSRLRNTIARKRRKLEREHETGLRMFLGDEARRRLADYEAAYSASWKANEQYAELLSAIADSLSAAGWTRLGVLYIDGHPAAAQLWFVVQNRASIFRLAYDESWKQYSPGSILTAFLMEYVINVDDVEEIDFLTGNEAYKQDWMSERRQRIAMTFARRGDIDSDGSKLRRMLQKLVRWKR